MIDVIRALTCNSWYNCCQQCCAQESLPVIRQWVMTSSHTADSMLPS
jgi:hypothetical protein